MNFDTETIAGIATVIRYLTDSRRIMIRVTHFSDCLMDSP